VINNFDGEYAFLSNFYESPFIYKGITYPTAEHAFQAAKTLNPIEKRRIALAETPGQAKRLGRTCALRGDWEKIKYTIMTEIVREKFYSSSELANKLLATGDELLEEGNTWHDNIWGNCSCNKCIKIVGQNHLGKILMEIRKEIRAVRWLMNELAKDVEDTNE
jgi:ribA/ribD-fused uncharacterized protein